jgi:hypothetical protein
VSGAIKMLTAIKLIHTLIWAVLAANVVALPVVGVFRRFRSGSNTNQSCTDH